MKYTLQMNALSSLSIAIEKFKSIYYFNGEDGESVFDENIKMCAIFLENSIELLLKSILVLRDPLSIYKHPNSKKIKDALSEVDNNTKLEDILIKRGDFQTITYTETINKCCESNKVKNTLTELGYIRNAITHFGVIENNNEVIISFIKVFDVIYNYLYPEIIELDEIAEYFTSDELLVNTIHGTKPLFDENYVYNNIIDFLDELMEVSRDWCYKVRIDNPKYKIRNFTNLLDDLMSSENFKKMFDYYKAYFNVSLYSIEDNDYHFEIGNKNGLWCILMSIYSPYYNSTSFVGESGELYFRIDHSNDLIFIYSDNICLPEFNKKEFEDYEWQNQIGDLCTQHKLTKRNIKLAIETILISMNNSKGDEK